MKVTLKKDFEWYADGIRPTTIPAGSVVESPIAENALQMGLAEAVPDVVAVPEVVEEKAIEVPLNKAAAPTLNKKLKKK